MTLPPLFQLDSLKDHPSIIFIKFTAPAYSDHVIQAFAVILVVPCAAFTKHETKFLQFPDKVPSRVHSHSLLSFTIIHKVCVFVKRFSDHFTSKCGGDDMTREKKEIICPHCGHVGPAKEFETAETEAAPGKEVEA